MRIEACEEKPWVFSRVEVCSRVLNLQVCLEFRFGWGINRR